MRRFVPAIDSEGSQKLGLCGPKPLACVKLASGSSRVPTIWFVRAYGSCWCMTSWTDSPVTRAFRFACEVGRSMMSRDARLPTAQLIRDVLANFG